MNRFSVFGISLRFVYENPELEYFNSCRKCNLDFDVLGKGATLDQVPQIFPFKYTCRGNSIVFI